MAEKLGLVFSGGGTKGSYEIGVWSALRQLGIDTQITGVSASSIGSYNTALFAQGNCADAIQLWKDFTKKDFMNVNYEMIFKRFFDSLGQKPKDVLLDNIKMVETASNARELVANLVGDFRTGELKVAENKRDYAVWLANNLFGDGFATPEKLMGILQEHVDFDYIASRNMDLFSTICKWDNEKEVSGEAQYISWKNLSKTDILSLIATSMALPVLYPHGEMDGAYFVDGGYADNVPIQPLYDAGYRDIIVVYLEKFEGKDGEKRFAMEQEKFPDANLIRILPRNKEFDDSFANACSITPQQTLDYLKFGYEETLEVFRGLAGEPEVYDLGEMVIEPTEGYIAVEEKAVKESEVEVIPEARYLSDKEQKKLEKYAQREEKLSSKRSDKLEKRSGKESRQTEKLGKLVDKENKRIDKILEKEEKRAQKAQKKAEKELRKLEIKEDE